MRTDTTLLAQLDQKFQWRHAYRRRLLCELTLTLVRSGRGWLTALGRDLRSPAHAKHRIKRVDRFVGNARLHADLPQAYQSLCQWVIQSARPVILVDWTTLTDTHWLLVASVPCQGRAHIIVQEAHKKKRVATPQVQRPFLTALSRIVPPECTPIVISDAGFMGPWFGGVRTLGWDFVGRLPSNVTITTPHKKEQKVATLRPQRCDKPEHLGVCAVTKSQPYQASLVIVRQRKKGVGRRRSRRCGTGMNSILHTRYKRCIRSTWTLVTSLHQKSASQIVALYKSRMQCEEAFRDAKNLKLGLGLARSLSRDPKRLQVLALLVALAHFVTTVLGRLAHSQQLHKTIQANTLTHRRVFSIPRLGALAYRLKRLRSITQRA